eukprot:scaffold8493_cov32-Tisochrysis_lutea.AAC.1
MKQELAIYREGHLSLEYFASHCGTLSSARTIHVQDLTQTRFKMHTRCSPATVFGCCHGQHVGEPARHGHAADQPGSSFGTPA